MPDIQRIIIELSADVTELEPAVEQLEKLGEIDKKTADAFKKTNSEIAARSKVLNDAKSGTAAVTEATKQTAAAYEKLSKGITDASKNIVSGASTEVLEGFADGVNDALKEAGVTAEQFEQAMKDALQNGTAEAPKATEKVVSLKTQLRQMKEELASLDPNSARFKELSQEAGQLQDKIGDVALEVRNLASDTRNIDGVVQGVQGLAGAFQLAEGSAALFGAESEDIQQSLVRLTALMNVSNGLQQVGNLLQRQSAAVLAVSNIQQRASIVLKSLEGAAESKNIVIRTAAIISQKALNAAMAANPAGILVVALTALAGALIYLSSETDSAAEAQTKLNEAQLDGLKLSQSLEAQFTARTGLRIQSLEDELTLMRARGASAVDLAKKELEIANAKAAQFRETEAFYKGELQGVENLREEYNKLSIALNIRKQAGADEEEINQLQSELTLVEERLKLEEKLASQRRSTSIGKQTAGENLEKAQAEEAAKALEELNKKREEAAKRQREIQLQALNDRKALIEAELLTVEDGTKEQEQLRLALVQAQAVIDLFSLQGTQNTEAQRNLIVAKGTDEEKRIRLEAAEEIQRALFEAQNKVGSTDVNLISAELAQAEEGSRAQLEIKNALVEAQADLDKLAAQEKFATSKKSVEDERVFASEIIRIDAETNATKAANSKEYFDEQERLRQEELERVRAQQEEIEDILINGAFAAVDAIVANSQAKRQQEIQRNLDATLEGLNKEKDAELKNKNLTAQQKEKIEEKYRKKEADAKLAAWKADQNARLSAAESSMALAIINALATGGPYPLNIAAAAAVAALGAIQIANIASETPPSYYKGTEYLERGENPVGRDTIPVMAHEGERIVPTENNKKYYESYTILQNEKITPKEAKLRLSTDIPMYSHPSFTQEETHKSFTMFSKTSLDIDYAKLGAAVSDDLILEMERNTDEVTKVIKGIGELSQVMTTTSNPSISIRHAR